MQNHLGTKTAERSCIWLRTRKVKEIPFRKRIIWRAGGLQKERIPGLPEQGVVEVGNSLTERKLEKALKPQKL